ncbi:hypothetical protein BH20CHL3_BH20CHL3_03590 [soil metagenome]
MLTGAVDHGQQGQSFWNGIREEMVETWGGSRVLT